MQSRLCTTFKPSINESGICYVKTKNCSWFCKTELASQQIPETSNDNNVIIITNIPGDETKQLPTKLTECPACGVDAYRRFEYTNARIILFSHERRRSSADNYTKMTTLSSNRCMRCDPFSIQWLELGPFKFLFSFLLEQAR